MPKTKRDRLGVKLNIVVSDGKRRPLIVTGEEGLHSAHLNVSSLVWIGWAIRT